MPVRAGAERSEPYRFRPPTFSPVCYASVYKRVRLCALLRTMHGGVFMTVLAFDGGDLFTVRVTKHHSLNPSNKWANSYEFEAKDVGGESQLLDLATAVADFEAALHYDTTIFDRVLISTWAPDSVPYNPATFISSTLTLEGAISPTSDPLALNQALSVTRSSSSGRFGHLFFRNCVSEGDVQAPAGVQVLSDRPAYQTRLDAAIAAGGLDDYIGVGGAGAFTLAMVGKTAGEVRYITFLRVQGMSTIPTDHAWFNRT